MRAGISRLAASRWRTPLAILCTFLFMAQVAYAQSPWERAANNLSLSFTGPLARSLSLVAIVLGGIDFMFGTHASHEKVGRIVFGGGLALFATQFLAWLF